VNLFHLCYQTLGKVASMLIGSCKKLVQNLQVNHMTTVVLNVLNRTTMRGGTSKNFRLLLKTKDMMDHYLTVDVLHIHK
jgi:hypothetical protein